MRIHDLKVWPEFYEDLRSGVKTFEIRRDDRGFAVGDTLCLREWDPAPYGTDRNLGPNGYTGRVLTKVVTYKFPGGRMGIPEVVCVLGLSIESPKTHSTAATPDDSRKEGE